MHTSLSHENDNDNITAGDKKKNNATQIMKVRWHHDIMSWGKDVVNCRIAERE